MQGMEIDMTGQQKIIYLIFLFETGSPIAQTGLTLALCEGDDLELLMLLPLPPKCRDYRYVPADPKPWAL